MQTTSPEARDARHRGPPSPRTISPAAQDALQNLPSSPSFTDLAAHRAMCARVQQDLGGTLLGRHGVHMDELMIGGVPVRRFTPPHRVSSAQRVLLNLHGGGFIVDAGSITENVSIAAYAGMQVVAARYRLAPEYPFPAAVDDAEAVYRSLLEKHAPEEIGLYGTSAGACLCTQLLVRLRTRGLPLPCAFGFFSGTADLSRSGDSEFFFRPAHELSDPTQQFAEYVGASNRSSPEVSAIFADLRGLPPTLCIAGTRDFLLSQTALFHQALLRQGVNAQLRVFEAMPHAHWIFLDLPESDQAFRTMAGFFTQQFRSAGYTQP
jgi:epsilon-lactone hydrolase